MEKTKIISFRDLDVYQRSYKLCIAVMTKIVPNLPASEKFDLKDQLSRSCKAISRLIAEGYGRRNQQKGFQKYLEEALAECNETIVSLSQAMDIYPMAIDKKLCGDLISECEIVGKQIYRLGESWDRMKGRTR
jgi:four helix bundle protein